jgi:anaerobic selenocysteine-containing dehydrogenase
LGRLGGVRLQILAAKGRPPLHAGPTTCFNCESGCGLLAYVDKETFEIRKFEGNPKHPGSRGRNCAKGPATHNQIYDPERILYPLKRVGKRGEGRWKQISWEEALSEIGEKMRASRQKRKDGIVYHVGRPGEDGYTNRVIQAWGVDGHNSHTNICSAGARTGYYMWGAFDRPSPDHTNARAIPAHLQPSGNGPLLQPARAADHRGKMKGAKIITFDPRLSNTASMSDVWLPTWPGSEQAVLLAMANYLIQNDKYDKTFVRQWVNWQDSLEAVADGRLPINDQRLRAKSRKHGRRRPPIRASSTASSRTSTPNSPSKRRRKSRRCRWSGCRKRRSIVANCDGKLATHTWRSASIGNLGGWQVARTLFFLNMLTGSVGTEGGTSANSWNKFVPRFSTNRRLSTPGTSCTCRMNGRSPILR